MSRQKNVRFIIRQTSTVRAPSPCLRSAPKARSRGETERRRPRGGETLGFFAWIIFGLLVGLVARWIVPGEGPGGVAGDIVIGIIGAVVGGWLYGWFGHPGVSGF